jgi:diacylglycerol kinase
MSRIRSLAILKRLYSATQNSLHEISDGFKTEPALRDDALLVVLALAFGLIVAPSNAWYTANGWFIRGEHGAP